MRALILFVVLALGTASGVAADGPPVAGMATRNEPACLFAFDRSANGQCGDALESFAEAVEVLENAAGAGDLRARFILGGVYGIGDGVPQDPVRAYFWYTTALDAGYPHGTRARDQIVQGQQLTEEQVAEANDLAVQWLSDHPVDAKKKPNLDYRYARCDRAFPADWGKCVLKVRRGNKKAPRGQGRPAPESE